jgi:NADH-quinone oxidoreductase subunit N
MREQLGNVNWFYFFSGPFLPLVLLSILIIFICLMDAIYRTIPFDMVEFDKIIVVLVINYLIALLIYCSMNLMSTTVFWYNNFSWDYATGAVIIMLIFLYFLNLPALKVTTVGTSIRFIDLLFFSILTLAGLICVTLSYDLIVLFLSFELQALALYVLVALNTESLKGAESALKYYIFSAISSCFLAFGFFFLYAATGCTALPDLQIVLKLIINLPDQMIWQVCGPLGLYSLKLSLLFIIIGIFIKIGLVPFHNWLPDVYHGMPLAILMITSTSQKFILFLFVYKFFFGFTYSIFWENWSLIFSFFGILSILIGSIFAIGQLHINRLLAYSSIVHAGFLMIGVSIGSLQSVFSVFVYMFFYFLILSGLILILVNYRTYFIFSKKNFNQDIQVLSITGLSRLFLVHPFVAIIFSILLFSLAGIPPLAGFFGKYFIILALLEANLYFTAGLVLLATVISSFYYIRLIKISLFETNYFRILGRFKKWEALLPLIFRNFPEKHELGYDNQTVLLSGLVRSNFYSFSCSINLYFIFILNFIFIVYPSFIYSFFTNFTYALVYVHLATM